MFASLLYVWPFFTFSALSIVQKQNGLSQLLIPLIPIRP